MTEMIRVAAERPYEVVIDQQALMQLPSLVPEDVARVAVVHPPVLADVAAWVRIALPGREVHLIEVPNGEAAKSASVLEFCWQVLGAAGFTRSDLVVGMGGGATTDLAGFVAASWLRGVPFLTVPTTVLGMVDAAVGGKTGINTAAGKNLVGAFHEPIGVLCDLDLLTSLPDDELRSGLAEVVKCGFIADPSILELLDAAGPLTTKSPILAELIAKGIAVKADVVSGDLREGNGLTSASGTGIGREALNYGHTLGHAIERVEGYRMRHGEAISIGMVFAAELGRRAGKIDDTLVAQHREHFDRLGLPTSYRADAWDDLLAAMRVDKKSRGNTLRFVVLGGLGQTEILTAPSEQMLRDAYAAISS